MPTYSHSQLSTYENCPYQYKLAPGYLKEVWFPVMLMQLRLLGKIAENKGFLTDSERAEMDELEKKMRTLLTGGYVGAPKRELNF